MNLHPAIRSDSLRLGQELVLNEGLNVAVVVQAIVEVCPGAPPREPNREKIAWTVLGDRIREMNLTTRARR